jgi:hypothetical protein
MAVLAWYALAVTGSYWQFLAVFLTRLKRQFSECRYGTGSLGCQLLSNNSERGGNFMLSPDIAKLI